MFLQNNAATAREPLLQKNSSFFEKPLFMTAKAFSVANSARYLHSRYENIAAISQFENLRAVTIPQKKQVVKNLLEAETKLKFYDNPKCVAQLVRQNLYTIPTKTHAYKLVETLQSGNHFFENYSKGDFSGYVENYRMVSTPKLIDGKWTIETPMFKPWNTEKIDLEHLNKLSLLTHEHESEISKGFYPNKISSSSVAHAPANKLSIRALQTEVIVAEKVFKSDYQYASSHYIENAGNLRQSFPEGFKLESYVPAAGSISSKIDSVYTALNDVKDILSNASTARSELHAIKDNAMRTISTFEDARYMAKPYWQKIFAARFGKAAGLSDVLYVGGTLLGGAFAAYDLSTAMKEDGAENGAARRFGQKSYASIGSTAGSYAILALLAKGSETRVGFFSTLVCGAVGAFGGDWLGKKTYNAVS